MGQATLYKLSQKIVSKKVSGNVESKAESKSQSQLHAVQLDVGNDGNKRPLGFPKAQEKHHPVLADRPPNIKKSRENGK